MRLYDAHNHLQDERFGGGQDALIAACREAGVAGMVVNGSTEADWGMVAELARRHPGYVIPSFGLHPWYVHERTGGWRDALMRYLDGVAGAVVGEVGVDRWILECPPAARGGVLPELAGHRAASLGEQADVFSEQLAIAAERGLPVSVHCLQAWGVLMERLAGGPRLARGLLMHSYGGSAELVGPLVRLGAYFSFPGYYLHERKARQREVFRGIPGDRLLVETDAPDQRLPGVEELGRVVGVGVGEGVRELRGVEGRVLNHPANLGVVYAGLAACRGVGVGWLAGEVEGNYRRLFGGVGDQPPR